MKMCQAPELLKKTVTLCKRKTAVLAARFIILASLRRRMATVGTISHRIHALLAAADREKGPRVGLHKALQVRKVEKTPTIHGDEIVVNLSRQVALFDLDNEGDGSLPDWTLHPIFNDHDNNNYRCYTDECEVEGDEDDADVLLGVCDEEGSGEPEVMDVIKNNREVKGLEFNIDDEIDQAADMFIARVRKQMSIGSF